MFLPLFLADLDIGDFNIPTCEILKFPLLGFGKSAAVR